MSENIKAYLVHPQHGISTVFVDKEKFYEPLLEYTKGCRPNWNFLKYPSREQDATPYVIGNALYGDVDPGRGIILPGWKYDYITRPFMVWKVKNFIVLKETGWNYPRYFPSFREVIDIDYSPDQLGIKFFDNLRPAPIIE